MFLYFWRLQVRGQGVRRFGFSWSLSPLLLSGLLPVTSLGLESVRVQPWYLFLFSDHLPRQTRALPLWTHLTLITSSQGFHKACQGKERLIHHVDHWFSNSFFFFFFFPFSDWSPFSRVISRGSLLPQACKQRLYVCELSWRPCGAPVSTAPGRPPDQIPAPHFTEKTFESRKQLRHSLPSPCLATGLSSAQREGDWTPGSGFRDSGWKPGKLGRRDRGAP